MPDYIFKTYIDGGREYYEYTDAADREQTIKKDFPFPESLMELLYMDTQELEAITRKMDRAFRAEMPRRGEIPTFRWGKHSVRLYAGRTRRGKAPAPPAPRGRKEFNAEKEISDHHRKNDTGHQRPDPASG